MHGKNLQTDYKIIHNVNPIGKQLSWSKLSQNCNSLQNSRMTNQEQASNTNNTWHTPTYQRYDGTLCSQLSSCKEGLHKLVNDAMVRCVVSIRGWHRLWLQDWDSTEQTKMVTKVLHTQNTSKSRYSETALIWHSKGLENLSTSYNIKRTWKKLSM